MSTPLWWVREIHEGDVGPDVTIARRKLGLAPGPWDGAAAERVRGMARKRKIESDGEVNAAVAKALGEAATTAAGLTPLWYERDLQLWFEGPDVRALRGIMGLSTRDNRYDPDLESAVRRFQSARGIVPTGRVDAELAKLIGEAPSS